LALTALLEAIHQFGEPTTEDSGGTGTNTHLAKQATDTALSLSSKVLLPKSTKHFGDLVSILVARNGEQTQQGSHRRESARGGLVPDQCDQREQCEPK